MIITAFTLYSLKEVYICDGEHPCQSVVIIYTEVDSSVL